MSTSEAQHYVYQRRYVLIVTKGHYSAWRWGCPLSMPPHYREKGQKLITSIKRPKRYEGKKCDRFYKVLHFLVFGNLGDLFLTEYIRFQSI